MLTLVSQAGIRPERLVGSNTSVFVGSLSSDYKAISGEDSGLTMPMYYPTGIGGSMLANRLSYFYDLRGPSIMIDTACSSSLGGMYLACQSLISGSSDQAIVGGSNVILDPRCWSSMSAMRFLSPDGRCFSFDHRANGYARGEGTACVMLKPLDAAIRDGNTIRAVIRHIGTNQDGKTMGITLPSKDAQESLIRRLYAEAGLKTSETSYLETHGTGTQAGDPLEAGAIASVFAKDRAHDDPLIIGSVKTNVGHTEGLSGLAALVKTVLMLEHRTIVPNCNFEKPNANIPLQDWKLRVPTTAEPWVVSGPRRASLNNFGFGGSNFHAILEDAEGYLAARGLSGKYRKVYRASRVIGVNGTNGVNGSNGTNGTNATNGTNKTNGAANGIHESNKTPKLFVLSAFHESMAKEQAARLKSYLKERLVEHAEGQLLEDLSYSLAERRTHHTWRKAIMASSLEELHDYLQPDSSKFSKAKKTVRLGFVFTGQGAQWYAMGRELMSQYTVFLESLQRSQRFLHKMGAPWSLIDELTRDETSSQLGLASLAQPACTAIQVALVDLLETWDVRPSAVVGHSSGEIAGAYACGAISHEGAMLISYHRGVLAASIKPKHPELDGAMIAASLTPQAAEERIAILTRGKLTVACINSPQSVTIAGDSQAVDELQAALEKDGVFNRKLRVEVAYHSHHMQVVAEEYLAALSNLEVNTTVADKCSFYSSVRGKRLDGSQLGSQYWVDNMVSTVQFASALKALCLDTHGRRRRGGSSGAPNVGSLVEIGPHAALAGPIKEVMKLDATLGNSGITYTSALYRKKDAVVTAMELATSLFESGY
ncbi:type I polyketide synthase [Candidatus Bathyarchaeota archaeon]|nr:type I polyketide synthase [Candidatus Bathyarchaeota archaeon]